MARKSGSHKKTPDDTPVYYPTTVRFTAEEMEELERRRKKLGLKSRAAVIRVALGFELVE